MCLLEVGLIVRFPPPHFLLEVSRKYNFFLTKASGLGNLTRPEYALSYMIINLRSISFVRCVSYFNHNVAILRDCCDTAALGCVHIVNIIQLSTSFNFYSISLNKLTGCDVLRKFSLKF